jgi:hypothetical protein
MEMYRKSTSTIPMTHHVTDDSSTESSSLAAGKTCPLGEPALPNNSSCWDFAFFKWLSETAKTATYNED